MHRNPIPEESGNSVLEDQRAHGATFRRLADLAHTLRAAHDEGTGLIRDLIDATVSSISAAPELRR